MTAETTSEAQYRDRQLLGIMRWEEARKPFFTLERIILGHGAIPAQLKLELHTVMSKAIGCAHCQAHGSFGLHHSNVDLSRIHALFDIDNADCFSAADMAAFRLAQAAAQRPNATTPAHHAALREHYDDQQIREIFAVIAWSALLNTYCDTMAIVTDQGSADWACENLAPVGWDLGKHVGAPEEQLPNLRAGMLER